jgi:formamidopyrimidine-DNA glycosylase
VRVPELPDVEVYVERLERLLRDHVLVGTRVASPFVLRTFEPALSSAHGRRVVGLSRLGKRIVFELEGELFLVVHLMIAGRFKWLEAGAPVPARVGLFALDFDNGTLVLTEAGMKRRASLHVVQGREALAAHNPGGVEPLTCSVDEFHAALLRERHTLKRSLTDPHLFSGIGNAYSDEILHHAKLSPAALSTALTPAQVQQLYDATCHVLTLWLERLRAVDVDKPLPTKVTAFHDAMAVHGRAGKPCPECGAPVQKIAYADNETNYCAACQTHGKLLKDRGLSRLLKDDWPRTLDELELVKLRHRQP